MAGNYLSKAYWTAWMIPQKAEAFACFGWWRWLFLFILILEIPMPSKRTEISYTKAGTMFYQQQRLDDTKGDLSHIAPSLMRVVDDWPA